MILRAEKILSANDLGLTGGHQAGILVPKQLDILAVFPTLDETILNPTVLMEVTDPNGQVWELAFKYYNNKIISGGTRNEYRITRLTRLLREAGLRVGDKLIFTRRQWTWDISWERTQTDRNAPVILDLSKGGWISVRF